MRVAEIAQMSTTERLQAMADLWDARSHTPSDVSPIQIGMKRLPDFGYRVPEFFAGIHPVHFGLHKANAKRFPFVVYYDIKEEIARVGAVIDMREEPGTIFATLKLRSARQKIAKSSTKTVGLSGTQGRKIEDTKIIMKRRVRGE